MASVAESFENSSEFGQGATRSPRDFWKSICLPSLAVVFAVVMILSVAIGPTSVSFGALGRWLVSFVGGEALSLRDQVVLFDIRMPRTVLGALIGASLGVAGAMMQGLFRNPLADPGLIGVASGSSLAAVSVIVLASHLPVALAVHAGTYLLPLAAFFGGLVTTLVLYKVSTRGGETSIATMLLAGIALGALTGAVTGLLIFKSDDAQLRDFTFWSMGSLGAATWQRVLSILPFVLALLFSIPFLSKGLNALLLGEAEAFHMGFNTQKLKRILIIVVAAATGAAVSAAGAIGFVGIVVPHLLRLLIGPDHRLLLPCCALLGAALLVAADMVSRSIVAPAELPIGIIMAVIGAPVFLSILLGRRSLISL
ncbi:FecCD family ABC transporter permease [Pseudovibrio exalbescens]|uniref:FecCD family ABC transporter permease n=1 Tax=Pseudovibrio exalbescens TaxID=197461 RepID=UPI003CC7D531